jgi:HTH-type transcriptional regulator, transcriptional repressor of NAD biosynthesis genes
VKQYRSAVIFGKFWPLHVGHLRLINEAIAASERVIVVVDDGSEDVPIQVRTAWVREAFPSVEVVTAPDLCGHDTTSCTRTCSERYAAWLIDAHGPVAAVFAGEPYGSLLASSLGAACVLLDREGVPAAGRVIRSDLIGHWDQLAGPARAWYCKRAVIIGAESTGTTTLAVDLARRLGTVSVPEYGRLFTEERGLDHKWISRDFEEIACRQMAMEDDAAQRSGPVLVCDTDVLATAVWHERYVGGHIDVIEHMASQRRPHLYVLTADDIAFVQDGLRDGEYLRGRMTQRFRDVLSGTGVPWLEVRGTRRQRVEQVVGAIKEHLGSGWAATSRPSNGANA